MTEPNDAEHAESAQHPSDARPGERAAPDEHAHAEEHAPADATSLVAACLNLLAAKAWEGLGLVPSPQTKKVERNLDDAQVAIDAVAAIAEVLRARVSDNERREIETLVTNLRLNFVEQKNRAGQTG